MLFPCSHNESKTRIKEGFTVLFSSQKDNTQGAIWVSNYHFERRDWGEFQDSPERRRLDPPGRVITIAMETIWTTEGTFVGSLRSTGENYRPPCVTLMSVMQSRRFVVQNEGITLNEKRDLESHL